MDKTILTPYESLFVGIIGGTSETIIQMPLITYKLYKDFNDVLRTKLESIELDQMELGLILFQFKLDCYSGSANKSEQFIKEKNVLRKRISNLENDVFQAENNLGYFSISKGAEKLFEQINKKNEDIKNEIALLKRQIKMIPNE